MPDVVDADRAARMKNSIRAGEFNFFQPPTRRKSLPNLPSVDEELQSLLLDEGGKLQKLQRRSRRDALMPQHKTVWARSWRRLGSEQLKLEEDLDRRASQSSAELVFKHLLALSLAKTQTQRPFRELIEAENDLREQLRLIDFDESQPEQQVKHDSGKNNNFFENAMQKITDDIKLCYGEKLSRIRAKMEYIEVSRPDQRLLFLAEYLINLYKDHPNCSELWLDMFQRLSKKDRKVGVDMKFWLDEKGQISLAFRACMKDLRRERDRISKALRSMADTMLKDKEKKDRAKEEIQEQKRHCLDLMNVLEELRRKRREKDEEIERMKVIHDEAKRKKNAALQMAKKVSEERIKQSLREHKAKQEQIKEREQEELALQVRDMAKRKREKQMQDFIRANLRKVMAEKKKQEIEEKKRGKAMEELAKEARLESLRKSARMSLGLLDVKDEEKISTATQNTKSHEERIKVMIEERSNKKSPLRSFKLFGYTESDMLADPRLTVEKEMRESGLLKSKFAVQQILEQLQPPTNPRPDNVSQISF